ncbi:MAG: uncharacterized membrane protein HdeD (DUF308 family) [Acidimicrobiales bacterium]
MNEAPESITNNDELIDTSEATQLRLVRLDRQLVTSPAVLRAIAGITVGLALLTWPDRTDQIVARLIGLALVWLAATALRAWGQSRPRDWLSFATSVATAGVGALLLLNPDRSTVFLGRVIGLTLLGYAAHGVYGMLRTSSVETGQLTLFGLFAAIGFVLSHQAAAVFGTVVAIGAIWSTLVSVLMLVVSLDARTTGPATYGGTTELVGTWLRDRPKSVDARQALYDKTRCLGRATRCGHRHLARSAACRRRHLVLTG